MNVPRELAVRDHLDDLEAMLLADGEPHPTVWDTHVAACDACARVVAALRGDSQFLRDSLALDQQDLRFLASAALPARVADQAMLASQEEQPLSLWGALFTVLLGTGAGYAGWIIAAPLLAAGFEAARWSGATALLARVVAGWAIWLVQQTWLFLMHDGTLATVNALAVPALAVVAMAGLVALAAPRAAGRFAALA